MSSSLTPAQLSKTNRLVWIDCEMTGLDPSKHVLVEIAAIITDANLIPLDEGIDIVIHATEEELSSMDSFVHNMHTKSGLLEEIQASTTTRTEAEEQVLDYMKKHIPVAGVAPLAGNSIATDRTFINAQMPQINDFLHYRMIDVSTIKELVRRWQPRIYQGQPEKGLAHRALQDIKESIRELEFYRQLLFMPATRLSNPTIEESALLATKKIPTT